MRALVLYADDIVLVNNFGEMQLLKKYLVKELEIKELGYLEYNLDFELARSKQGCLILRGRMSFIYFKRLDD